MSFPFPKLLTFLESEQDQLEFMKIAAEVGIDSGDLELAKILLALQLYKAFYADIPRAIRGVHEDAISEMRSLRDDITALAERTASDSSTVQQKADAIRGALDKIQPAEVAKILHKRLLDDTLAAFGGSSQALKAACGQVNAATQALNEAGYQAAVAIDAWQTLSLRRVWISAFCFSLIAAFCVVTCFWFVFLRR